MNRRILKLNKTIQKILMEYLIKKKKVPLMGIISVKEVSVASDIKSAKIFISVMHHENCSEQIYNSLEEERYFIQKAVARCLKTKFCPKLHFFVNYVSYNLEDTNLENTTLENKNSKNHIPEDTTLEDTNLENTTLENKDSKNE